MHLFLISPLLLKTRHKEAGILRCVLILLTHTSEQLQTKGGVKKKKRPRKENIWEVEKEAVMENEYIKRRNRDE